MSPNVIFAPHRYLQTRPIVFLSGTIRTPSQSNWRDHITSRLSHLPITILNPHRPDWDNSWVEHIANPDFKQQVDWELDGMEAADIIAVFFDSHTDAPITLLELGLFVRDKRKKCVVGAAEGYARKGNVQVVCERYGIQLVGSKELLAQAVLKRLKQLDIGT